jgi:nitrite reductase/ring-hydroxylating ferredoxin subunit/Fe-S cluster biogenesis protein NfuA
MAQAPPQKTASTQATVQPATSQATLDELVNQINRYQEIVSAWDSSQQAVVMGLKEAIEALHKEALTRLIRTVKQESMTALRQAVEDEVVYGLLRYHELIKPPQPPLGERLQRALAEVRPSLQSHNGDVELVAVRLPDTVEVRFIGTCSHCPASSLTLSDGVEQAIKRHCPEILYVVAVSNVISTPSEFTSGDPDWRLVTSLAEIPEAGVLDIKLEGFALILSRVGTQVSCFHNACTHLGVPIDSGSVKNGVLTCPYHGFQYRLTNGECLTAPEMPLQPYPVRVENGQVYIQLS